jgi:hypothetical protein
VFGAKLEDGCIGHKLLYEIDPRCG